MGGFRLLAADAFPNAPWRGRVTENGEGDPVVAAPQTRPTTARAACPAPRCVQLPKTGSAELPNGDTLGLENGLPTPQGPS